MTRINNSDFAMTPSEAQNFENSRPQATHTQGPWFYDGQNNCGAHVVHVAEGEIAEAFCDSWSDEGQQAEANARLIAAAPDMLAALENALPWLIRANIDGAFKSCAAPMGASQSIKQIQAAIAKAVQS